jgi:hypothetical protein
VQVSGSLSQTPPYQFSPLALASSSRSQVQTRTASAAARLAWDRPSVDVRWRPPLSVAIVTHLVTQSPGRTRTAYSSRRSR